MFWGFITIFPGEIVHLEITAEKNFFRQQFGNHITILNQDMFFKGSEIFFPRFLNKNFLIQVKFHPSKHSSNWRLKSAIVTWLHKLRQ